MTADRAQTEPGERSEQPTIDTIVSELREAYEAGTAGNWEIHSDDFDTAIRGPKSGPGWYEPITDSIGDKDAELVVKAHNYLPRLLDELELTESYRRAAGSLFDDEHLQSETAHVHMRREAERENERLRKRLVVLMRESAQLDERLSRFEETLTTIANQDYRGNRCSCSTLAYKALKAGVGE